MIKPGMYLSDRYEIIDKVGSGGMADVYKARDHKLNRFVAIKILKTEYNDDKTFVKKFRGEAQSAAGLSHPNIVNIFDVGEDEGMHYIIMELIEGITLKRFIERKGKLEIREAVGIGIQIAQGMEVAHAHHIIHRDIKPQNIIISREGKVKVTDFGIAKATSSNTITSNAMGSVHYFSPEQARGGYCDEKSDIYSLGVTIYEMISGHVPFEGENAVSVALLHIQKEAKSLREMDPSVPISIDRIVQKCMQKKPERRYLSVSELVADLKRSIIEPDVDFVVIPDILKEKQPTVVLSKEEIETIRKASSIKDNDIEPADNDLDDKQYNDDLYGDDGEDDSDLPAEDEEYEEDGDYDDEETTKGEKIALIFAITSAVIVALLVIFVILKVMGVFGGTSKPKVEVTPSPSPTANEQQTEEPTDEPENLDVPSLIGKMLDEAREIADKNGFVLRYEEVESAKTKDMVVDQKVEGNTITVYVSDGSGNIEMLDLAQKTFAEAKAALTEAGFTGEIGTEYVNSDEIEVGYVVESDPPAGEMIKINELEKVTLYVSEGASTKTIDVPSLLNKTEEEARAAITAAGMIVGTVSQDYSDDYEEGKVCAQSKKEGAKVTEGAKIDITVSLGKKPEEKPEMTVVPNLVGKTEDEAAKAIEKAQLKVKRVYMDYSDDIAEGLVIRQTVNAGDEVEIGTEITYTVSLGKKESEEPTVTPEPTQPPVEKHSYQATVQVFSYGENPFMDPELADEGDADKTSGSIKVQVVNSNDNKVVYTGSVSSSYAEFNSSGFSYSFNFDSDVETSGDQLVFTYTFDNRNYDYSGSSKVELK